ncbi:hypothetical protein JCM11491_004333 [Sporobolomyces phaffii]
MPAVRSGAPENKGKGKQVDRATSRATPSKVVPKSSQLASALAGLKFRKVGGPAQTAKQPIASTSKSKFLDLSNDSDDDSIVILDSSAPSTSKPGRSKGEKLDRLDIQEPKSSWRKSADASGAPSRQPVTLRSGEAEVMRIWRTSTSSKQQRLKTTRAIFRDVNALWRSNAAYAKLQRYPGVEDALNDWLQGSPFDVFQPATLTVEGHRLERKRSPTPLQNRPTEAEAKGVTQDGRDPKRPRLVPPANLDPREPVDLKCAEPLPSNKTPSVVSHGTPKIPASSDTLSLTATSVKSHNPPRPPAGPPSSRLALGAQFALGPVSSSVLLPLSTLTAFFTALDPSIAFFAGFLHVAGFNTEEMLRHFVSFETTTRVKVVVLAAEKARKRGEDAIRVNARHFETLERALMEMK